MRAIRWMVLAIAMLAGIAGLRTTAEAAPLPVPSAVVAQTEAGQGAVVEKAYWRYRRYYGYRPYYRRHYYRPRYYGYRRHYWHRPYYRRRFYY
ncbi:hypothetical protein [Methylobacterium sp. sgz302541]|uniref:hypothetical protein n=1 Tax=unclassified Methylobacterium TaxID=2615210 RepID=UPI003D344B63